MPVLPILGCIFLYCLSAVLSPASARIYACKSPNGTTFQDAPCNVIKASATKPVKKKTFNRLPVDIEKSWLEKPGSSTYTAWCDKNGCECGPYNRVFDAGMVLAVADALYLDGSWHRYDNYARELAQQSQDAAKKIELSAALEEAACNIIMSQSILKKYTGTALKILLVAKREAEDRGFDTPEACDLEEMEPCEIYSQYELYKRMMQDIKSLKSARNSYTALLE